MRTAYCVLRIGALSGASFGAYCVLRIAYCVFEARSQANFEVHCVLRTAYCVFEARFGANFAYRVLRTAYCVFEALSGANFEAYCVIRSTQYADTPTALTYLLLSLTNCILIRSWGPGYAVVQYVAYTVVARSRKDRATYVLHLPRCFYIF